MFGFWSRLVRQRDFYAGGLMVLLGLVAVWKGPRYGLGTLMMMGPGFMPTALGTILILLGVTISGTATINVEVKSQDRLPSTPEWRGWACVLGGPICFIIFGSLGGLIPAAFSCVFVSALGDRTATLKSALTLAAVVTLFGIVVFSFLLHIPLPILKWGGL